MIIGILVTGFVLAKRSAWHARRQCFILELRGARKAVHYLAAIAAGVGFYDKFIREHAGLGVLGRLWTVGTFALATPFFAVYALLWVPTIDPAD
jgi:hypothetical protein